MILRRIKFDIIWYYMFHQKQYHIHYHRQIVYGLNRPRLDALSSGNNDVKIKSGREVGTSSPTFEAPAAVVSSDVLSSAEALLRTAEKNIETIGA